MDISNKINSVRTVLGDSYMVMVFDRLGTLDDSYTLYVDRVLTDWHLKMRFSRSELIMMGESFVGAVCRRVVSEYANFITRGAPK